MGHRKLAHFEIRSHHKLTLAWAGQSHFNTGELAELGRASHVVLKCDEFVLKYDNLRYLDISQSNTLRVRQHDG